MGQSVGEAGIKLENLGRHRDKASRKILRAFQFVETKIWETIWCEWSYDGPT